MNVYVDPGVHASGVAWFDDHALVHVEYRHACAPPLIPSYAVDTCVCEIPVVRRGSRVRPKDLIALAVAAGRVTGCLETRYITPESWKGQIPCTCTAQLDAQLSCTHHRRMFAALTESEKRLLFRVGCLPSLLHNVYDAVTMGLKFEGRLRG